MEVKLRVNYTSPTSPTLMDTPSPQYSLNGHDMARVGQVLFHSVVAVLLVQGIQLIPHINFGSNSVMIVGLLVPLMQMLQRYLDAPTPVAPAAL